MVARILDLELEQQLIAQRQASGADRYDEVWDGEYVMSPLANDEHQELVAFLNAVLFDVIQRTGLGLVRPGVNLSNCVDDWRQNYRCPDVVVFLKGGAAVCHGTFWTGGPDFAVEILSPGETTVEKIASYGRLGTRELLIVHRDPWQLELFRLAGVDLQLANRAVPEDGVVVSRQVALEFRLAGSSDDADLTIRNAAGLEWKLQH